MIYKISNIVKKYFILFLLISSNAWSYEPDTRSVKDALIEGRLSFIGRVVKIEEIEHAEAASKAHTTFQIIRRLGGTALIKNEYITLSHYSRAYIGYPKPVFGVSFIVSEEYLIVISGELDKESNTYLFRSNAGRADMAYEVDNKKGDPYFSEDAKSHYYSTIYGLGYHGDISLKKIIQWSLKKQ